LGERRKAKNTLNSLPMFRQRRFFRYAASSIFAQFIGSEGGMVNSVAVAVAPKISRAERPLLDPKPMEKYAPRSLYDLLMRLDVPTPVGAGKLNVTIDNYLNAKTTPGKDPNGGPGLAALKEKLKSVAKHSSGKWILPVEVDTSEQMMSTGMELEVEDWELWRFFVGKASPQEIRRVLFLAQAVGLAQSTPDALQAYCDQQAGMDCSGFASVAYGYHRAGNEGYSASAYRSRGKERTTIEEISAGDAIVWLNENHIAVVDKVTGPLPMSPPVRCRVAESTAGNITAAGPGVQYSEYAFERDTNSTSRKYRCLRPKAGGGYTALSATQITVRGSP
jgi:hypothetical protein